MNVPIFSALNASVMLLRNQSARWWRQNPVRYQERYDAVAFRITDIADEVVDRNFHWDDEDFNSGAKAAADAIRTFGWNNSINLKGGFANMSDMKRLLRCLTQDLEDLKTGLRTVSDDYIRGFEAAVDSVRDIVDSTVDTEMNTVYDYTRKYRAFQKEMKAKEKESKEKQAKE